MTTEKVYVPDIGEATDVEVIEVLVKKGDHVSLDDSLVVLESDKASMEIPSPMEGLVDSVSVNIGDKVDEGDPILVMQVENAESVPEAVPSNPNESGDEAVREEPQDRSGEQMADQRKSPLDQSTESVRVAETVSHAGPSVRKQAREYGVELSKVTGTGKFGRIVKSDLVAYVKQNLSLHEATAVNTGIPEIPKVDFSRSGEIEVVTRSRIQQASARNLHRSWLNIPHVTQFDQADITDLERFRKDQNLRLKNQNIKMTLLVFFIKAVVSALQKYRQFNASLEPDGEHIVYKKYINIGIAVETDAGLVVPVIRDADKKGLTALAVETAELASKARAKKLDISAVQGATFTISSLGGIGGTAFTPIINAPEVAILGVSRSKIEAVYDGTEFKPRTMLPLSLSYDHRAIDGAAAARFTNHLIQVLADTRHMMI